MKKKRITQHPILSLASLLLFFLFVLFLLPVLILSAEVYRSNVKGQEVNNNLYTASNYITAKFRQHNSSDEAISFVTVEGTQALCFIDVLGGDLYYTYLYLQNNSLKELFVSADIHPDLSMGTPIADLTHFEAREEDNAVCWFNLTDTEGNESVFALCKETRR
ncbi:MAG: DUF4860 domain-containing protein [Blautia sp.]|nr:DUF4860 domain-containing protein [Blautia sp.]